MRPARAGRVRAATHTLMRILLSGSSGLLGGALLKALPAHGHVVRRLVRRPAVAPDEIAWDPAVGAIERARLEDFDAVVHVAGAGIANEAWTEDRRLLLRESRVGPTRLLAETLAVLKQPPRVLLCASGVGWYGDRGETWLDETSGSGAGFLAELARDWEAAAGPAAAAGIRVVHSRTGLVLTPAGGALARLLPIFRLGLGGPVGTGRQWWSWISLPDLVAAFRHALEHEDMSGAFNAVSPSPVSSAGFARALGAALRRPAVLPAPAFALRWMLGRDMADQLLLASQRVRPRALQTSGFAFTDPELEPALRRMLSAGDAAPERS